MQAHSFELFLVWFLVHLLLDFRPLLITYPSFDQKTDFRFLLIFYLKKYIV